MHRALWWLRGTHDGTLELRLRRKNNGWRWAGVEGDAGEREGRSYRQGYPIGSRIEQKDTKTLVLPLLEL